MKKIRYVILAYANKEKSHLRWIMDLKGIDKSIHDLTYEQAQEKRKELENARKD